MKLLVLISMLAVAVVCADQSTSTINTIFQEVKEIKFFELKKSIGLCVPVKVPTFCEKENAFIFYKCCKDSGCCWRLQGWVWFVGGCLTLLIFVGTIVGCCCCICRRC